MDVLSIASIRGLVSAMTYLIRDLKKTWLLHANDYDLELRVPMVHRNLYQCHQSLKLFDERTKRVDSAPTWFIPKENRLETFKQYDLLLCQSVGTAQKRNEMIFRKELEAMPQQLHAHRRGFLEIANKLQGDTHGMERTKRDSGYCDLATWGIGNHSSSEPSLNTKDASPGDQTDIPDWNHHEDAVLPCVRREDISRGGFGCIWQIAIHSEHQRILSGGQDVGGPAPTMKRLFTPIVCDCSVTSRNSATSVFARKVHFRDHFRDYYWEDLALKQTQQYGTRSYWHRGTGSPRLIGALNLGSTLGMGGTYLWLNKTMRLEPPTESMQWIIEKTCNLIPSFLHDLPDFPDWAIFILFAASTVSFTGTTFLWASNRVQKPIAKVLACMVATLGMIACMLAGFGAEEILLVGIPLSISMGILANFVVRYRTDEQKEWKEEKRGLVLEV